MIESLRARLTVWYVTVLGAALVVVCVVTYFLLARTLYKRIDVNLAVVTDIAVTSLTHDLAEGQGVPDAARSTVTELFSDQATLAIYDGRGQLLAEAGRDDDLHVSLPALDAIPLHSSRFQTVTEMDDADDRHRLAVRRAYIGPSRTEYIILVGSDLERTDEELASLRTILLYVVPVSLVIAAIGGWFLARHSLAPVMSMAERARRIGVENLGGRLPVANPRDELGRLASTFNELLERLAASFSQQRHFMADASHELRTPVATTRTAAAVALQQPHRAETEYREALQIIERQTGRLGRVVEDMFLLARADAGNYPVQRAALYLEEIVDETVRASRVLARARGVTIACDGLESAPFEGDEDLLRRIIRNLVDNAVRYAPAESTVSVTLAEKLGGYVITVSDNGPGIPADARARVFERFFRVDVARSRSETDSGGAGLGLSIARWAAQQHSGDVSLVESTGRLTTFRVDLPAS